MYMLLRQQSGNWISGKKLNEVLLIPLKNTHASEFMLTQARSYFFLVFANAVAWFYATKMEYLNSICSCRGYKEVLFTYIYVCCIYSWDLLTLGMENRMQKVCWVNETEFFHGFLMGNSWVCKFGEDIKEQNKLLLHLTILTNNVYFIAGEYFSFLLFIRNITAKFNILLTNLIIKI